MRESDALAPRFDQFANAVRSILTIRCRESRATIRRGIRRGGLPGGILLTLIRDLAMVSNA
jgi:hypothetical protein